jgi:hypothetical protein
MPASDSFAAVENVLITPDKLFTITYRAGSPA